MQLRGIVHIDVGDKEAQTRAVERIAPLIDGDLNGFALVGRRILNGSGVRFGRRKRADRRQSASTNAAQQMIFFIIDDSLIGKHDDIAHRAFLAAGGHIDDLPAEIERRRAAAVQIESQIRALVEEQLLRCGMLAPVE